MCAGNERANWKNASSLARRYGPHDTEVFTNRKSNPSMTRDEAMPAVVVAATFCRLGLDMSLGLAKVNLLAWDRRFRLE